MNLTYTIPETKKDITVERFLSISRLYKIAEDRESEVTETQLLVRVFKYTYFFSR